MCVWQQNTMGFSMVATIWLQQLQVEKNLFLCLWITEEQRKSKQPSGQVLLVINLYDRHGRQGVAG